MPYSFHTNLSPLPSRNAVECHWKFGILPCCIPLLQGKIEKLLSVVEQKYEMNKTEFSVNCTTEELTEKIRFGVYTQKAHVTLVVSLEINLSSRC